jgi:hypothetical protein
MQFHAGRSADQRRGPAAVNARNPGEPAARYDSARHRAARRHQHRSDSGDHAGAEHDGVRREHDNESGDAGHNGAGQRYGRRSDAGRIAAGLLTGPVVELIREQSSSL